MADMSSKLRDRVTCGICMEKFDMDARVPKVLPCQHTLCLACMKKLSERHGNRMICPMCRCATQVPGGGVLAFPNNIIVQDLMELLQDKSFESPAVASSENSNRRVYCREHEDEEISKLCQECHVLLCPRCESQHKEDCHQDGDIHFMECTRIFENIQRELSEHMKKLEEQASRTIEQLTLTDQELDVRRRRMMAEIKGKLAVFAMVLKKWDVELNKQVTDIFPSVSVTPTRELLEKSNHTFNNVRLKLKQGDENACHDAMQLIQVIKERTDTMEHQSETNSTVPDAFLIGFPDPVKLQTPRLVKRVVEDNKQQEPGSKLDQFREELLGRQTEAGVSFPSKESGSSGSPSPSPKPDPELTSRPHTIRKLQGIPVNPNSVITFSHENHILMIEKRPAKLSLLQFRGQTDSEHKYELVSTKNSPVDVETSCWKVGQSGQVIYQQNFSVTVMNQGMEKISSTDCNNQHLKTVGKNILVFQKKAKPVGVQFACYGWDFQEKQSINTKIKTVHVQVVLDDHNERIVVCALGGRQVASFNAKTGAKVFVKKLDIFPRSMAVGCRGQIFILDANQKVIHTLNRSGQDIGDLALTDLDLDPTCEVTEIFGGHPNYLHVRYQKTKQPMQELRCYELEY